MKRLACTVTLMLVAAGGIAGEARVPAPLVGSWYAGSGYTSAPYDPRTGAWGTPTGKGLIYVFRSDGSYTKAFQSYVSNGGCTTGFTAFEAGRMAVDATTIYLAPREGKMSYRDSCVRSLNSDKPLTDLHDETLAYTLDPEAHTLRLANPSGAASVFRAL